jgi:thioredoxin reductase
MNNHEITVKDLKAGTNSNKEFHNLYSIIPTRPHKMLEDAKLVSSATEGLLDVDKETLRHNKYKNIFGIGDVCNLPTTHSFWGGW